MGAIKHLIKHPATNKRLRRVFVEGKGWYGWNSAYHVYNSESTYEQLQEADRAKLQYPSSSHIVSDGV